MSRFALACCFAFAAGTVVAATAASAAPPVKLPPRPPDGTYAYALRLAGTDVGSSTVVVDGATPGAIVVKENASFLLPRFTATTTMRYDATTLHETGYSADFNVASGAQHTDVAVKPGTMTVTATNGGGTADVAADPSAPLELIGDNLIGSSVMIPAVLHATGAKAFTLAVLTGGKAVVCNVVTDPLPSRPASVPASDANLALDLGGIRETYWYDPATYVVHDVTIPSQSAEIHLASTAAPGAAPPPAPAPQLSALPTPTPRFTSRDVRFTSADGTALAGTLTVPDHGRCAVRRRSSRARQRRDGP